jgi:hypothetical protein
MGSFGAIGTIALMVVIAIGLLAFILYLNSTGAYGNMSITPTVNAFVEVIAVLVIALVVVVAIVRR